MLVPQPRATLKFPLGEISLEERDEEEEKPKRAISVNGLVKSHIMNGVYTARFSDENLDLRYAYKVISCGLCFFKKFIFIFLLSLFHGICIA